MTIPFPPHHESPAGSPTGDPAGGPADPGLVAGSPPVDPLAPVRRPRPRWSLRGVTSTVTVVLLALFVVVPVPYAIEAPGPTENVLGSVPTSSQGSDDATSAADGTTADATSLITVTGTETHPTTGKLLMTTVSGYGSPSNPLNALDVLKTWASRRTAVVPIEVLYPPTQTQEETDQQNAADMATSQQKAVVAALTELGYEVPATIKVVGGVTYSDLGSGQPVASTDALAGDVVKDGDVVRTLQGAKVTTYQDLLDGVADVLPGDEVTLGVTRDGKDVDLVFHAIADPTDPATALLGLYLDPSFDPPVKVDISLGDQIGGPSAGSMFALGIIDKVGGGDLTRGKTVAGTGTIDFDGAVGAIGGIRHKMYGALDAGAVAFLAPASNCNEVYGNVPDGLAVYAVSTLHEAREALTKIGTGDTADLPVCGPTGAVAP